MGGGGVGKVCGRWEGVWEVARCVGGREVDRYSGEVDGEVCVMGIQ